MYYSLLQCILNRFPDFNLSHLPSINKGRINATISIPESFERDRTSLAYPKTVSTEGNIWHQDGLLLVKANVTDDVSSRRMHQRG
jgi:hypothetical protein